MPLLFRVRRPAKGGQVMTELRTNTLLKALRTARQVVRETQRAVRIERKVHHGWETAMELMPEVRNPVEAALARGHLPRVQTRAGQPGRVVAYIRPRRTCRVEWINGSGTDEIAVDDLELRK